MATHWVKQSRSERLSTATTNGQPMSFVSGNFTHALATLAIDKRTEREKVALVEALLLSRQSGNQKKAEAKLIEFNELRHKIVRDHWNKAIHQVIIQHNIPARVKARKQNASAEQTQSDNLQRQQQPLKSSIRQHRKVDTQVRFNLERQVHSFENDHGNGAMPGRQTQCFMEAGNPASGGQASQHQQLYRSSLALKMPQFHNQSIPGRMFQTVQPSIGLQSVPSLPAGPQPFFWAGSATTAQQAAANNPQSGLQTATSQPLATCQAAYGAAPRDTAIAKLSSNQPLCGPFPFVPSQPQSSVATGHGSCNLWATASLSSCPTESSEEWPVQAASMPPRGQPAAPPAVHRGSLSSCPTESSYVSSAYASTSRPTVQHEAPIGASDSRLKEHSSPVLNTSRGAAAATFPGTYSGLHRIMAPGQRSTASCTTECSSEADHSRPNTVAPSAVRAGQLTGRPLNAPTGTWNTGRSPAESCGAAEGSEFTESSSSIPHVQEQQHAGDSAHASTRDVMGVQGIRACGHSHWGQSSPACSVGRSSGRQMMHSTHEVHGSPGMRGGTQRQHCDHVAGLKADKGPFGAVGKAVWTVRASGADGSSSLGSYESSSHPSAGPPATENSLRRSSPRGPMCRDPAMWAGAGGGTHAGVGPAPWRATAQGKGAAQVTHMPAQQRTGVVGAPHGGSGSSVGPLQLRGAVANRLGTHCGSVLEEPQGSETTESSDEEDE